VPPTAAPAVTAPVLSALGDAVSSGAERASPPREGEPSALATAHNTPHPHAAAHAAGRVRAGQAILVPARRALQAGLRVGGEARATPEREEANGEGPSAANPRLSPSCTC
jgi:hypothetical protein